MSTVPGDDKREFEIAGYVADLLDQLPAEKQRQVMALLAARYGFRLSDPPPARSSGYRPGSRYGRTRS